MFGQADEVVGEKVHYSAQYRPFLSWERWACQQSRHPFCPIGEVFALFLGWKWGTAFVGTTPMFGGRVWINLLPS